MYVYVHIFPLFSFLVLPGFMLSGALARTLLSKGLIDRPDGAWHCFSKERNRYPAAHRAGAVNLFPVSASHRKTEMGRGR